MGVQTYSAVEQSSCTSYTNRQYFIRAKVLLMNISSKKYQAILDKAPADHHSDEFIKFLARNNRVVLRTPDWLVIENIKYHTKELPWYTAFDLKPEHTLEYKLQLLQWELPEWKIIIHPAIARTIKRFHLHLIRVDQVYNV